MQKNPELDRITEEVRRLPILQVVGKQMNFAYCRYGNYFGLCPFHDDTHAGSFSVSETLNRFTCFSCGAKGDSISLYAKIKGLTYFESKMEIAYAFGIIDSKTFERFSGKTKTKNLVENVNQRQPKNIETPKKDTNKMIHFPVILNTVYSAFLDLCELSEAHANHLTNVRKLTSEIINERKYKSNVEHGTVFFERLREELRDKEVLKGKTFREIMEMTPGFYQRKCGNEWVWKSHNTAGILIPIQNELGQITALQIRADNEMNNGQRYVWFSSTCAKYDGTGLFRGGISPGAPLDVLYPKETPSKALFITEGRFKAEAIADRIGAVVISVQGVTNWKGIENLVTETEKEAKKRFEGFEGFKNICMAFDRDIHSKYQVYQQLKRLSDELADCFGNKEIFYITWDGYYSGIDDLLGANIGKTRQEIGEILKIHNKNYYDEEFERQLSEAIESNEKGPIDVLSRKYLDYIKIEKETKEAKKKRERRERIYKKVPFLYESGGIRI
ncbi:MAG: CHC2 zinc finger domain-containing protein [Tepidanaerobacteraceae bacterium]|nr:CHC2 zinc finger domain-containing protein [Tepidanaerobacteraceae bacterium]